jgi:hypothetical protein
MESSNDEGNYSESEAIDTVITTTTPMKVSLNGASDETAEALVPKLYKYIVFITTVKEQGLIINEYGQTIKKLESAVNLLQNGKAPCNCRQEGQAEDISITPIPYTPAMYQPRNQSLQRPISQV